MLPEKVLKQAQAELLEYGSRYASGASVLDVVAWFAVWSKTNLSL